jgi:hypothetical protein
MRQSFYQSSVPTLNTEHVLRGGAISIKNGKPGYENEEAGST